MSHKLLSRIGILATACIGLSLAQTAQSQTSSLPGYIGLSVGRATADIDCTGALSCDRSDTAWKLFGGYLFHPYFAVEVDVRDHGRTSLSGASGATTESGHFLTDSVGLYALATAREGPLSGFAKLGLATTRARGVDRVGALGTSQKETHTRPAVGLGLSWDFTERISARLEIERIQVKFGGTHRDVDLFSAGVQTRF